MKLKILKESMWVWLCRDHWIVPPTGEIGKRGNYSDFIIEYLHPDHLIVLPMRPVVV